MLVAGPATPTTTTIARAKPTTALGILSKVFQSPATPKSPKPSKT